MNYLAKIFLSSAMACAAFALMPVCAQNIIEIDPLFEYPVAPEELPTMYEKSNYIVEHFWDNFDLKTKRAVDQNALNHAFKVYSTALRFADRDKSLAANQKLLNNISKNPTLLLQFVKAAEENIYGPRAEVWMDEVYTQFLKAITSNKNISKSRKERYASQLSALSNTAEGMLAPKFSFENRNGNTSNYFPMSTPTLIIFGDPWNTDWRMARLKMESNLPLIQALDKGKINILYILPEEKDGWKSTVENYSSKWTVGAGDKLNAIYDMRVSPSIYVIGNDGKILKKNISLPDALDLLIQQIKD